MSVKFIPSNTFKNGCMLCANEKVSIFNPDGKTTIEYTVESSYQAGNSFLFVKDTSIEFFMGTAAPRNEHSIKSVEETETSSLGFTEKPAKTKYSSQDAGKHNLGNFLCQKKVDYKDTVENEMRHKDKEYERRVKEALRNRKMWKELMNTIEKMKIKDAVVSRGPEWYQDLSHNQIKSLRMLQAILKADLEEGIVARTKRFLTSLGVTVNIPSRKVYRSNKECNSDPVCFLLEMYNEVVEIEAKSRPDLGIDAYSVNKRLLLSSICTLHLPVLINLMHLLLPPPLPGSIALVKTLFDSERYRYSQPHLEPLPNRTKKWLNLLTEQELLKYIQHPLAGENKLHEEGHEEKDSSIQRMLSICEEKQEPAVNRMTDNKLRKSRFTSTKFYVRRDTVNRGQDISGDLADKLVQQSNITKSSVSKVPKVTQVLASVRGAGLSLPPQKMNFSSVDSTNTKQPTLLTISDYDRRESVEVGILSATSKLRNSYFNDSNEEETSPLLQQEQQQQQQELGSSLIKTKASGQLSTARGTAQQEGSSILTNNRQESDTARTEQNQNTVSVSVNRQDEKSVADETEQRETEREKIQAMLDSIAATPVKQQLQRAISLLAEAGDPLALFPDVHRIPSVKRWFEMRRGIKRSLTKKENDELIELTMTMWKNTPVVKKLKIPKLDIPKAEQKVLTWDDQHRVRKKVDEQLSLYFTQMKEQKVNNTRALFPTMLNQYYVSKLNRQFRKVFYTYLPARAADVYVYRPWLTEEHKPKQNLCY